MELERISGGDEFTHVALKGRLDTRGVDQVETSFTATVVPAQKNALVNLSEVTFLSSMGVRMILTVAKALERKGARMVLMAPLPLVQEALRHSSIDEIIPVVQDLDGAVAAFTG